MMTSAVASSASNPAISVTNFDLSSLYLLRPEISVTLKNAERHLSEFNDDEEQAPLLLDSVVMLNQLAAVLKLISLTGSSDLAKALSNGMQRLYDSGDNNDESLILGLSQGIMTLSRYIEFVLLQETLEPSLLLPVINQLHQLLGHQTLDDKALQNEDYTHITLANPAKNFKSLTSLGLNASLLSTAYRAGLQVLLANTDGTLNESEQQKLEAMHQACAVAADTSNVLFWQAAAAATKDIAKLLPLDAQPKKLFIFLDQQFHSYLSADDSRFAELVSFACLREHRLALVLRQQLKDNQLEAEQLSQLRQFMFGPDQEITRIVNTLIQQDIDGIKTQVSHAVYDASHDSSVMLGQEDISLITDKLNALASTMHILKLEQASATLQQCVVMIQKWRTPTAENLVALLNNLMIAENAAITLAKSHTPGAQTQSVSNTMISIHQLDTAYGVLVNESRQLISQVEQALSYYLDDINKVDKDIETIKDVPSQLKQVAGALRFLELTDAANMINQLSHYLADTLYVDDNIVEGNDRATYNKYAKVADVLLAIDHQLSALQKTHPIGKHAMSIANSSLSKLLAA